MEINFDRLGEPVVYVHADGRTCEVSNPYPKWQQKAGEGNCWGCYRLLWTPEQVTRHLCDVCFERTTTNGWTLQDAPGRAEGKV
jgi:hypothetical protein